MFWIRMDVFVVGPGLDPKYQQRTKVSASKEKVKASKNGNRQVIPVIHHLFYKVPNNAPSNEKDR